MELFPVWIYPVSYPPDYHLKLMSLCVELLFELISGGTTNDSNNDNNTEKMSQTGSSEVAVWREQHLQPLRQMLMRGQRRMAITYAQNNSLFDHALALSYLTTFQTSNSPFPVDNGLMLSTIRKFISSSLSTTDPRK